MLYLLSPAKTLDYDTPLPAAVQRKATEPVFTSRAAELIGMSSKDERSQKAASLIVPILLLIFLGRPPVWNRRTQAAC